MIKPAINNIIVKIDVKYLENFYNMVRAANIVHGSQINPADYVNIIGEIISIPKIICDRRDYKGFSTKDMLVGDSAIFRYDVVFDFEELEDGTSKFKNLFWFQGKEYWMVDIQKIFAVIRKNEIIMVNGYCMIENMSKPQNIILPPHLKKNVNAGEAILTHIGNNLINSNNLKIKQGTSVFYNPLLVQEYKIKDKKFGIIRQKDILGVKNIE